MDLKRALLRTWKEHREKVCVVDENQRFTFDQVVRRAVGVSQLIAPTDRSETGHVAIILPNSELFLSCFLGCLAADRAAVPINYLLSPPEARFIIEHSQSHLVLTVSHFRPLIDQVRQDGEPDINPVYIDEMLANFGPQQVDAMLQSIDPHLLDSGRDDPDRTACLIYTSGTTGVAKGVVLSHRNLLANCESMRTVLDVHPSDVFLTVLPLFHSFGMSTAMLLPLVSGASMVMMRRFHPGSAVDLVEREKASVLLMVASMFALIMRDATDSRERLSSIRIAVAGGGPLSPALGKEFEERIGFPLFQGYGLTEAAPVVATNIPGANRPESVGRPIPGVKAEIRDENNKPVPIGKNGEIWIHGENVMKEYYRNPEATAHAIDEKGWLRTGDTGFIDDEGFLYVTGRHKELIIFGGEKIFPQEVEHVLMTHPAIAEVAVVGVTDKLRGEIPKAFMVLRAGATIDERELRNWCADRLATFKIPREFKIVDALPKNALGKVLKHELAGSS